MPSGSKITLETEMVVSISVPRLVHVTMPSAGSYNGTRTPEAQLAFAVSKKLSVCAPAGSSPMRRRRSSTERGQDIGVIPSPLTMTLCRPKNILPSHLRYLLRRAALLIAKSSPDGNLFGSVFALFASRSTMWWRQFRAMLIPRPCFAHSPPPASLWPSDTRCP